MGYLYLVRHGQASFGKENYDELSERGRKQSRILARYFLKTGVGVHAIYSGSMERQKGSAIEFIDELKKNLQDVPSLKIVKGIEEYDFREVFKYYLKDVLDENPFLKEYADRMYSDKRVFKRIFELVTTRWVSNRYPKEGLESWDDFSKRVSTAILDILGREGRGKNIVVFTSGGVIASFLQKVLALRNEAAIALNWQIVNSSFTVFKYTDARVSLFRFNCIAHLELEGDSSLITYS